MTQAELMPALHITPPAISFNFEELEAHIKGITDAYTGLVVQEADVPAIKNEMAALNKLTDKIADARKEAVKRVSVPIKEFEGKVKGLEASIQGVRTFLDEQVKAHIQRERDGRLASVQFIVDHQRNEHGCPGLDIPIQESWLNKSTKDKTITAEVQAIILAHKRQQEEAAKLEQAKADRLLNIENHNAALAQSSGFALSVSAFTHLQSLDIPLAQAMQKMSAAYEREIQRRAPKPQVPADPTLAYYGIPAGEPASAPEPATPVIKRKAMTITGAYDAGNGEAIKALYQRMKALCVTCTVQIREAAPDPEPFPPAATMLQRSRLGRQVSIAECRDGCPDAADCEAFKEETT